jgi:hypothetical protein
MPTKGWTRESKESFWNSVGGSVGKCIEKMEGDVDDPGAFCSSLADELEPGWRKSSTTDDTLVYRGHVYQLVEEID